MEVEKKKKKGINPNPLPNSMRTQKRHNRGWKNLELSSRKHRRAARKLGVSRVNKPNPQSEHQQHVGGSINYNR